MPKDQVKEISVASTLLPNVRVETASGATVDLAGYNAATFVFHVGTITDGTFTVDAEDSPDGSNWTNIDSAYLSGTFTAATASADDTIQEVGYVGAQRYVRANIVVTGSPSTGGAVGISVIRGNPRTLPQ